MPRSRSATLALMRAACLGAAFIALFAVNGFRFHGIHLDVVRGIGALFVLGLLLPTRVLVRPLVPLLILSADLIAAAAVGTFLRSPSPWSTAEALAAPSLPFIAGFLAATLAAASGRRAGAALLGALAGAMLLVLGEGVLAQSKTAEARAETASAAASEAQARLAAAEARARGAPPPESTSPTGTKEASRALAKADEAAQVQAEMRNAPFDAKHVYLLLEVLLLATASLECAVVLGWIENDLRRRRTAQTIEREIRARDTIAGEMATLLGAATAAGSLRELAEALVQHLRRHFPTHARAIVLEDAAERVAMWEEAGRLDEDLVERRRLKLQDALRDAGSNSVVERMEVRATGTRRVPKGDLLKTAVAVPIHAMGRTCGVLFVGDSQRGVLMEDRISALAELARQTGEAVRRLDRARDEQTRRTSMLLGQMREGVLLLGPDARVLLGNPAGREMLRGLGRLPTDPVALGDARPQELASIPAGTVKRYSVTMQLPDGRTRRLGVAAVGVVDGGSRLGTLLTMTDVTEEEQARRRLMQAEKLSVVGQTLASVAHELNNPLAAIVGYADILGSSDVSPDIERILARVREQATRASRIVRNLLNVARKRGPERTLVAINDIVQSVIDLFAYDARLSNILILPSLAPDLPNVLADRHSIQQVLVNLVQNAIQALRTRGSGRIEIRTSYEKGVVQLAVRDDGPGIPPENRAKVFEAFFTTKGPDEGTGLGLAISRGIARDHGGDLHLETPSDGGSGALFVLSLPVEYSHVDPSAKDPLATIPDGVPAHVLVVDDEAAVRESLVAQLGRMGVQVDSAATPGEAERFLTPEASYDVVLMDIRMPGKTGLEVHRDLRETHPALADRVVFMTGDLVNDELLRAVKSTGNALLEKPFTTEELRWALSQAPQR